MTAVDNFILNQLDEKLTWKSHIKAKRRQLDLKIKKICTGY
jgi:hypothetical protein